MPFFQRRSLRSFFLVFPIPHSMATLMVGVVVIGLGSACQPKECVNITDCGPNRYCNRSFKCEDLPPQTPEPGGSIAPSPSAPPSPTAPPQVEDTVIVPQYATFMEPDPRNANAALVAFAEENAGFFSVDLLQQLDLQTGTLTDVYDLTQINGTACGLNAVHFEPTLTAGETWLSCDQGSPTRVIYNDEVAQQNLLYSGKMQISIHSPAGFAGDYERLVGAARGGDRLYSVQLRPEDIQQQDRYADSVEETFTGITQIFPIPTDPGTQAEAILVFDRGDTNRLVVLERTQQSETWRRSTSFPTPLELPAETHVVYVIGNISSRAVNPDGNVANIMTLQPGTGEARYFNLETGLAISDYTFFEPESTFWTPPPDKEERILLQLAPSGDALFYAVPGTYRMWRIPFLPGADTEVTRTELVDQTFRFSGIAPASDSDIWVSVSNDYQLLRLKMQ